MGQELGASKVLLSRMQARQKRRLYFGNRRKYLISHTQAAGTHAVSTKTARSRARFTLNVISGRRLTLRMLLQAVDDRQGDLHRSLQGLADVMGGRRCVDDVLLKRCVGR